jgi:hypothetical protein
LRIRVENANNRVAGTEVYGNCSHVYFRFSI